MAIFSKNLVGGMTPLHPPGYAYALALLRMPLYKFLLF